MRATYAVRPAESHAGGLSGLQRKRARVRDLEALRAAWGEVLRKVRWHLRQRRPRPQWGDSAIDYAIAGAQNLLLIAMLIAIGG